MISTENLTRSYFDDESSIDVDSTAKVLKTTKNAKVLIVVDNAAEYVDQIDALIKDLDLLNPSSKLEVSFVLAERENRFLRILNAISFDIIDKYEMNWLNKTDIRRIIDKLTEKDKLRILRGKPEERQIEFFQGFSENQLLVAMRELSGGGKFNKIISNEFKDIKNSLAQKIYAAVALCHSQLFSVSINDIHRAFESEIGLKALEELISSGGLRNIILLKKARLLTRHVCIAQEILKAAELSDVLTRSLKADLLINLMVALSFKVNEKELSRGTPEAKLVRAFMDFDHIENVLGQHAPSLDKFFTGIKDYYSWNSKYWAQRGLFESTRKHFADAIDFVNYAASLDSHWTIRNTQSVVYLRTAASKWAGDYSKAKEYFDDALKIVDAVLQERNYQEPKGFDIITRYTVEFVEAWQNDLDDYYKIFEHYYALAEKQRFIDDRYRKALKDRRKTMMKIKLRMTSAT